MAPVLALLDDVPGIAESRVDWTGRYFRLELEPAANVDAVLARADRVLGGATQRLERSRERDLAATYPGARWMSSTETLALSREEAGVLAERYGAPAARAAGLDADTTQRFLATLEGEIAAAFERIHKEGRGLPDNFDDICRRVIAQSLEKSRSFLNPTQLENLEKAFAELSRDSSDS